MSEYLKEQIEDYLLGRLSQEEQAAFEKELATNQILQDEVSFRRLTIHGVKQSGKDEMRDRLKKIHKEYERKNDNQINTKINQIWPKWIGIAASVLLLITAGIFFLDKNEFNSQVAFNEYYEAVPLRLATRDSKTEKTILQLSELYNNKEYKKALPYFQNMLDIDSQNTRMRLGAGICHLELNQLNSARAQFLDIIKAKDFRLQHQANWYMALTYLKEGNLVEVKKYLTPIMNDSKADHHEDAIEIMEQLN